MKKEERIIEQGFSKVIGDKTIYCWICARKYQGGQGWRYAKGTFQMFYYCPAHKKAFNNGDIQTHGKLKKIDEHYCACGNIMGDEEIKLFRVCKDCR